MGDVFWGLVFDFEEFVLEGEFGGVGVFGDDVVGAGDHGDLGDGVGAGAFVGGELGDGFGVDGGVLQFFAVGSVDDVDGVAGAGGGSLGDDLGFEVGDLRGFDLVDHGLAGGDVP